MTCENFVLFPDTVLCTKHIKSLISQIFQSKLEIIYEIISHLILSSNLQTISIESWRPEDGKGLFGKRVSAMASFLVLAKMASHREKTSPLYHNEPPTSIEPLRGCSSSSSLHIKRMSYTEQSSQEVPVPLLFIPAKLSGI